MKKAKRKRHDRTGLIGFLFMSPFIIGFLALFLRPLIQSLIYSLNKVTLNKEGVLLEYIGFANYKKALFGDGEFIRVLLPVSGRFLIEIVVVMFFSIFIAILLNQKMSGRLFFRTACFLPFIFSAEKVLMMLQQNGVSGDLEETSNGVEYITKTGTTFVMEIIERFDMGLGVAEIMTKYINEIFNVATDSAIPIVLFIIGLQTIPPHLYEVCDIEGATKWETFWKITFPMLSPTILLCLIYTLIVRFNADNEIVQMINYQKFVDLGYASARTWVYSVLIIILVAILYKVVSKKVVYLE